VRILLTRPEPEAQRTATALRALGHQVVTAPLLRIEMIADAALGSGPWAAILITSGNATRAIAAHSRHDELLHVPVFTVGHHSAQSMRDAGFTTVSSAGGDVGDLAELVAGRMKPHERLLYLAGEERSGDLAATLRGRNFLVDTVLVYRAAAAETLPRQAAEALETGVDAVLHFSRRSAEAYVHAVQKAGAAVPALIKPVHFCLSARVAEPLTRAGATALRIAAQPDEASLIDLVKQAQRD
jgi:uroporphyrinogen-III synthase